jgi:hypothetical protein
LKNHKEVEDVEKPLRINRVATYASTTREESVMLRARRRPLFTHYRKKYLLAFFLKEKYLLALLSCCKINEIRCEYFFLREM